LVSGRQSDVTVVNFEPNYYKLKKLNIDWRYIVYIWIIYILV
jgi:hypothetical protein